MPAQDEGQVPFDKLPKREIRDWIEDWLNLPSVNVLQPQAGGGTVSIINNSFTDTGFLREGGLLVPTPKFHTASEITANADDVIGARFIPNEDTLVSGVTIFTTQNPTGASKIDIGIYNSAFNTRLVSTGAVAHGGATGIPHDQDYTFTSSLLLTAGTEYVLAFLNDIDTGTWKYNGAVTVETVRNSYLVASTVAGYALNSWEARFAGTGWTSLQNADIGAAAAVAAVTDPPIAVLF